MKQKVDVNDWIAMFKEIGLDDAKMKAWHRVFETRHPEAHQGFLEWLGLPESQIQQIREHSR